MMMKRRDNGLDVDDLAFETKSSKQTGQCGKLIHSEYDFS
jgi:hypothetical protein